MYKFTLLTSAYSILINNEISWFSISMFQSRSFYKKHSKTTSLLRSKTVFLDDLKIVLSRRVILDSWIFKKKVVTPTTEKKILIIENWVLIKTYWANSVWKIFSRFWKFFFFPSQNLFANPKKPPLLNFPSSFCIFEKNIIFSILKNNKP